MKRKDNYVAVATADKDLLSNVVQQARGFRTLNDFSYDCGYTPRTFYCISRKEHLGKHLPDKMLFSIVDQTDKDYPITDDRIMAANGKINTRYIRALQKKFFKSIKLQKQIVKTSYFCSIGDDGSLIDLNGLSCTEKVDNETKFVPEFMDETKTFEDEYIEYLDHLEWFAKFLQHNEKLFVLRNARDWFDDEMLRKIFARFHALQKTSAQIYEDKKIKYFHGKDALNVPVMERTLADKYFIVLYELLIKNNF